MSGDKTDNVVGVTQVAPVIDEHDDKHQLEVQEHIVATPTNVVADKKATQTSHFYSQGDEDEDGHIGQEGDEWPTEEDLHTLRRVPDTISLSAYSVAIIELCERFSYYGTQVLCMCIFAEIPKASPANFFS